MIVGVAVRLSLSLFVAVTGLGASLRGGDEPGFIDAAQHLGATTPWLHAITSDLYVAVFGVQLKLFNASLESLRVTQVFITVIGLALLAAAVYDLTDQRRARIAAWLLALEPASAFFSSLLHKEPLMYLAVGLAIYGAARVWRRLDTAGLALMIGGCLVGVATRDYAGFFLLAGCALVLSHASILHLGRGQARSIPLLVLVIGALGLGAVEAVRVTQPGSPVLNRLRASQSFNSVDPNSHLGLEPVDFSNRTSILESLPVRIRDVLLRPYPWQVRNLSQQLGLLGTVVALLTFFLLLRVLWWARGSILQRAGPIIYPSLLTLIAYALTTGNAGTGFRYRTNMIGPALALLVVLWRVRATAGLSDEGPARAAGARSRIGAPRMAAGYPW